MAAATMTASVPSGRRGTNSPHDATLTSPSPSESSPSSHSLPTGIERRPGSSRVRRPPKRLLSPSPSEKPQQKHAAAISSSTGLEPSSIASSSGMKDNVSNETSLANSATSSATRASNRTSRPPTKTKMAVGPKSGKTANAAAAESNGRSAGASSSQSPDRQGADISATPAEAARDESPEETDTGPGKRKRKPSTMTRPPSTITAATQNPVSAPSDNSHSSTHSKSSNKAQHRGSSTEPAANQAKGFSTKSTKGRHSGSLCLKKPHLPSLDENSAYAGGYESDGGGGRGGLGDEGDVEMETDTDSLEQGATLNGPDHLEAPPLIFQRNGACLLKTAGGGRVALKSGHHNKSRHCSSPGQKQKKKQSSSRQDTSTFWDTSSSSAYPDGAFVRTHFTHHSRTQSMPSISKAPSWTKHSLSRASAELEKRALGDSAVDYDSDSSRDGDEDDFHMSMLDSDFEELEAWNKLSDFDTPATTPRSPQSSCGQMDTNDSLNVVGPSNLGTSSSSTPAVLSDVNMASTLKHAAKTIEMNHIKYEGAANKLPSKTSSMPSTLQHLASQRPKDQALPAKVEVKTLKRDHNDSRPSCEAQAQLDCNTVFAHALPPSDRPQTHVGLLTLSLPFGDVQAYTSPAAKTQQTTAHRFATPTLERMASREHLHDGGHGESPSSNHCKRGAAPTPHLAKMEAEISTSTSPTLSPTQAVFSLPLAHGSDKDNMESDEEQSGIIASPFLSAIRHDRHSRSPRTEHTTRLGSPVPFNLPESVTKLRTSQQESGGAEADEERRSSVSCGTSRDAASEEPQADQCTNDGSSASTQESQDGKDRQRELIHRGSEEIEDDSTFNLPETMALDEIDAAYGGCSQPLGSMIKVQACEGEELTSATSGDSPMSETCQTSSSEEDEAAVEVQVQGSTDSDLVNTGSEDSDITTAESVEDADESTSSVRRARRSGCKRSLEGSEALKSVIGPELEDSPANAGSDALSVDDSPRPRKTTRSTSSKVVELKVASEEDEETNDKTVVASDKEKGLTSDEANETPSKVSGRRGRPRKVPAVVEAFEEEAAKEDKTSSSKEEEAPTTRRSIRARTSLAT